MTEQIEYITPHIVINVRDENGKLMEDIDIAVYEKSTRKILLKEKTEEAGQVSMPIKLKRPLEIEVRCRKHIVNGIRINPFSEIHTVFPGGFELNVILNQDPFFKP